MSSAEQDKNAIQAVLDQVFSTYIEKDLEGMLSCYAADLVTMMPFGMPTYGLDEWRQVLETAFERGDVIEVVSDTEEILMLGDWAWSGTTSGQDEGESKLTSGSLTSYGAL